MPSALLKDAKAAAEVHMFEHVSPLMTVSSKWGTKYCANAAPKWGLQLIYDRKKVGCQVCVRRPQRRPPVDVHLSM